MSEAPGSSSQDLALLEELVLGTDPSKGRKAQDIPFTVLRVLTEADLPALLNPASIPGPQQTTLQIRTSHHQLARLIATGVPVSEISLVTGYAPSTITKLQHNPAFEELVDYYTRQKEQMFASVWDRMRTLQLNTLEELQARLEDEPEKWTKRELMELFAMLQAKQAQNGPNSSVNVNGQGSGVGVKVEVTFVEANHPPLGPIIDNKRGPDGF